MHRFVKSALCLLFVLFPAFAGHGEEAFIPAHAWRMQSSAAVDGADGATLSRVGAQDSAWHAVNVPTTVLAGLIANDVYPDPYFGLNLKDIPGYQDGLWLVQKEDSPFRVPWWFRVEFDLPENGAARQHTLHFDGINYEANIWLNGVRIADRDSVIGMFRRFEFLVTDHLNFGGRNALAVEIIPPGLLPEQRYQTKQIEATTGWDDHNPQPPDLNMGLWQPVYLREQGAVGIRHPYVETDLDIPGLEQARLTVSAFLVNHTDAPVSGVFSGTIEERRFAQPVSLDAGETREVFFYPDAHDALVFDAPRVWWPHPVGPQELYALDLVFEVDGSASDTAHTPFGIRHITTYINEDDWRGYQVNGRNILIRGGAWMTIDMMLNLEEDLYEALVRHAREAGFNMLRSEGFSIRETNTFYDLCDRNGVMVTQQIFGRNIPDEDLAIACIEDMMLRIRNHPSLAHFLGHDETFPTDTLDAAYRELIRKHRVGRTYQPHSGTFNIVTRAKTGGTRTGSRELWTYAGPSHYHFIEKRKHDSAWGFAQSGGIGGILAARDSIRQMMPAEALWPVRDNETWSFHTVLQGIDYFDALFTMLERKYGAPRDFEDFCNKMYAMNYNSARGMYEAYARHKYEALGLTTWKYNTAWPAALTWQYVDWYKRPSAAYYGAKKACAPVHALYGYDDEGIHVVNALYEPQRDLRVSWEIYDLSGVRHGSDSATVSVGADGRTHAGVVEAPPEAGDPYFLKVELRDAEGVPVSDNVYWLSRTPDIPGRSGQRDNVFYVEPKSVADFTALASLPAVALDVSVSKSVSEDGNTCEVVLSNRGEGVAFLVEAALVDATTDLEHAPVYWSDNYVVLFGGESRVLMATTPESLDNTYLRVQGYNVEVARLSLNP